MISRFEGRVVTEWLVHDGNDRDMRLTEDFAFVDEAGHTWHAYIGDVVNGASIPRAAWSLVGSPFIGEYRRSSVIHDVSCQRLLKTSRDVHRMFYQAMRCDGVEDRHALEFYALVRLFGPRWERDPETAALRSIALGRLRGFAEIEAALDGVLA